MALPPPPNRVFACVYVCVSACRPDWSASQEILRRKKLADLTDQQKLKATNSRTRVREESGARVRGANGPEVERERRGLTEKLLLGDRIMLLWIAFVLEFTPMGW